MDYLNKGFIFLALIAAGGFSKATTQRPCPKVILGKLSPTPMVGAGPFYPGVQAFADATNDLTKGLAAEGTVVVVYGQVLRSTNGTPISGVEIHIWQTDHRGCYNHMGQMTMNSPDPNFAHWGKAISDENGFYTFRTVLPQAYQAGPGAMRTAHIHLGVLGYDATEIWFRGDKHWANDFMVANVPNPNALTTMPITGPYQWDGKLAPQKALLADFNVVLPTE